MSEQENKTSVHPVREPDCSHCAFECGDRRTAYVGDKRVVKSRFIDLLLIVAVICGLSLIGSCSYSYWYHTHPNVPFWGCLIRK